MPIRAILISDGSKRFLANVEKIKNFLEDKAAIRENDIKVIKTAYLTCHELTSEIYRYLEKIPQNNAIPVLIYYAGHGGVGFWKFNEDEALNYQWWINIIKFPNLSVLFVNDCCYAHSLADCFQDWGVSKERVGTISASAADSKSYSGDLIRTLIPYWENNKIYPEQILRGQALEKGENLEIMNLFSPPSFWTTIHTNPRWRGILDHLKYDFLCVFYEAGDLIIGFIEKFLLVIKKRFGRIENKETPSAYDSKRWGAELDFHFFPKSD